MPSLKEVKTRIASVNSTRKITSAMKMVASSKLHHAQQTIDNMRPYEEQLFSIMSSFMQSLNGEFDAPYTDHREVKRVAIVLYTSNSSLCGGFNANVIKSFKHKVEKYRSKGIEIAYVYPLGKKAAEAVRKMNFEVNKDYSVLLDHPSYEAAAAIAAEIMNLYNRKDIDQADVIYHHFKSAGSQILTDEVYLPLILDHIQNTDTDTNNSTASTAETNYIIEPSRQDILTELVPKALYLKLYTALLDSLASEHAARMIAMQVATDNANDLLQELTLTYNKTRQQAITAELLDIVGGSIQ